MSTFAVPYRPSSAGLVRDRLARDLRGQGMPQPVVDAAQLVVSELVGNAVVHGRPLPTGDLSVEWELLGDRLRLQVVDGGDGPAGPVAPAADDAEGGRGLTLVGLLSSCWGRATTGGGTAVWADLSTRPAVAVA